MSKPTVYTLGAAFPIQGATQQKKRQVLNGLFLGVSAVAADTPLKVWDGTAWVPGSAPPVS
jgi:hypothetical protein